MDIQLNCIFEIFLKVTGVMQRKVKTPFLSEIIDITPWETISIEKAKSLPLKIPLICKIGFEDDIWSLSNEELSIIGVGKTFNDARRDFEEDFEDAVELYVHKLPEGKMSRDALELKKKLLRYVDG